MIVGCFLVSDTITLSLMNFLLYFWLFQLFNIYGCCFLCHHALPLFFFLFLRLFSFFLPHLSFLFWLLFLFMWSQFCYLQVMIFSLPLLYCLCPILPFTSIAKATCMKIEFAFTLQLCCPFLMSATSSFPDLVLDCFLLLLLLELLPCWLLLYEQLIVHIYFLVNWHLLNCFPNIAFSGLSWSRSLRCYGMMPSQEKYFMSVVTLGLKGHSWQENIRSFKSNFITWSSSN